MSLGSWDPEAESAATRIEIDPSTLERLVAYSSDDQLDSLEQLISGDDSQVLSGLMKLEHPQWLETADSLPDETLLHLIRFFTVAENLPGWEAGANSPVIPLAKSLRKRGVRLDKAMLQWMRQVNPNRYLPYGPL